MKRLLLAGAASFGRIRDRGLGCRHAGAALHQGSSSGDGVSGVQLVRLLYRRAGRLWLGKRRQRCQRRFWRRHGRLQLAVPRQPVRIRRRSRRRRRQHQGKLHRRPGRHSGHAGLQDQLIRKRRPAAPASRWMRRFSTPRAATPGPTTRPRFQGAACRFRIAGLIPAIRSAAASNICSRRAGRQRPSTCTPASAARPTISVAFRWIPQPRLPHHQGRRELSLQVRWLDGNIRARSCSNRRHPPCAQLRTGAGDPVFQRQQLLADKPRRTGYPACAGYDTAYGIDNGRPHTTSSTSSIVISTGLSPRISRPSAMPPR